MICVFIHTLKKLLPVCVIAVLTMNCALAQTISTGGTLSALNTTYGTASASGSFSVSGTSMSAGILVTPPTGFEVSADNVTFTGTVTIGAAGTIPSTPVYIRLRATSPATSYSGNVVLSSAGATNINVATAISSVSTRALTIKAEGVTKAPGATLTNTSGSSAYMATGLQNGENAGTVTITYGAGSAAGDGPGTYTNQVSPSARTGGSITPSNYSISYQSGNIVVGTSNISVNVFNGALNPLSTTFGTASGTTTFGISGSNLSNNITVTPPAGFEMSYDSTGPFGSTVTLYESSGGVGYTNVYVRLAAVTPVGSSYNGDVVVSSSGAATQTAPTTTSTVNPAAITITANNVSKTYGSVITGAAGSTAYTITPGALQNGNTLSSVTIAYGTGASATSAGATYTGQVTPSAAVGANGFLLSNYTITYATGNIIVNKAPLTIAATGPAKTYGSALTAGTSTTNFTAGTTVNSEIVSSLTLTPDAAGLSATTPAGAGYTVTPSLATGTAGFLASNYNITYTPFSGTVGTAALTVTATGPAKTYGTGLTAGTSATSFIVTGTPASGEALSSVTLTPNAAGLAANTAAGASYTVTPSAATGTGGFLASNYNITYMPFSGTVAAAALTITAGTANKTYGTALPGGAGSTLFSSSGLQNSETIGSVTIAYGTGSAATAAAGTYSGAVTPSAATGGNFNAANYIINYAAGDIVVSTKAVTATAAAKSKTYGDADPALTYTFTPALVGSDTFSGSLARVTGETVGSYAITPGSLALSSNYALTYAGASLTITPKAITATAAAKSKTYGDADPALTYTFTPALVGSDTFSGSLSRAAGENVGSYAITQGSLTLSSNYALTYAGASLTITTKAITATAAAKSKTYGDADPALTYTFTPALVGSDSFSGFLSRVTGENAGSYAITQGSLALSSNYALTYAGASLTITPKAITATAAAKSKTNGDADPALTYTFTPALVGSDSFNGSLSRATGENVGSYAITQGSLALSSNYALTYTGASLTVTTKAITATAGAKSKTYGDADPALTYTFTPALVGSDTFSGSLSRAAGENAGNYAITQGSLALSSNYTLSYVPANLTITAKPVTVTADAKTKVYGTADPALTYSVSPALVAGDTFTGSLSRASGENIGTYAINKNTLALSSNYTLSYVPANLTIIAKPVTVTADAKTKVYGSADPALTYSVSPALVAGDAFTGSLSRAAGENVGSYAINQGSLALGLNYTLSYVASDLAITAKPLTITADNKTRQQGVANPPLTASYSGFVNGQTNVVLTTQPPLSATATIASPQGNYPITVTGAAAQNYSITYVNGTLTVTPGNVTGIALAAASLYENRPAGTPAGTLSSSSDDPNASFTYTLAGGTGSADNASFTISGNQVLTTASMNFEAKSSYSIRVRSTTQYGLSAEQTFTINVLDVNEVPTINAIAGSTICYTTAAQAVALTGITAGPDAGQTVSVSVSSNNASLFESLTASGNGTNGTVNYTVKNGASGTAMITVTITDNGGTANGGTNTTTQTFQVTVNALPNTQVTSNLGNTVSRGEVVQLTATGGVSYVWTANSSIISGQNSATLTVRPAQTTTYTVTATSAAGCTQSQTFTLNVTGDFAKVKPSNIMSPNGDGVNDKWIIESIDLYPNNTVTILDRAGRTIYTKKGYDNSWNATINGADLSEGTYYYNIDFGAGLLKLKGFITIVR